MVLAEYLLSGILSSDFNRISKCFGRMKLAWLPTDAGFFVRTLSLGSPLELALWGARKVQAEGIKALPRHRLVCRGCGYQRPTSSCFSTLQSRFGCFVEPFLPRMALC